MLISRLFVTAILLVPAVMVAQNSDAGLAQKSAPAKATPRTADGHPDLNGLWNAAGGIASIFKSEKKEDGSIQIKGGDQFYIFTNKRPSGPPRQAFAQNVPSYKPEFAEKVKYLSD